MPYYEPEEILEFRMPELKEKEVVMIRLPDGRIVARTREEVEEMKKAAKKK